MKKWIILALLLAGAALYFGVITIRGGDGEFAVKVNEQKAGEVVDMIKQKAGELKDYATDKK